MSVATYIRTGQRVKTMKVTNTYIYTNKHTHTRTDTSDTLKGLQTHCQHQ